MGLIREKLFAPVFLLVIILILFYPLLFGGKIAADEESVGGYYPNMFFYQQAVRTSNSFLWNDSYYGGFPTYLNLFGGFLYPLHYLLFKFLPFLTAYHLAIVIPAFLGALFTYLFARAQLLSEVGSLIAALGYLTAETFGGFNTGLSYANGFMILPWMAFSVLRFYQAQNIWQRACYIMLGAIGATIGFLAGFPQIVLYSLAFVAVYALFLDYRLKVLFALITMVTLGALAAAPQLIATFNFLDHTIRTPGYTAQISDDLSWGVLFNFLLPYHLKIPYVSEGGAGLYIGVLPLMLALMAMIFYRNRTVNFFSASYLFIFLMGLHLPVISWLNDYLPIFSRISGVARWFLVGSFLLSILAAYGYDHLAKSRLFFRICVAVALVVVVGAVLGNIIIWQIAENEAWRQQLFVFLTKGRSLALPIEHYQDVFERMVGETRETFSLTNWRFSIPVLLFPLSFLALYFFPRAILFVVALNTIIVFASSYKDELTTKKIFEEESVVARTIKKRENELANFRYFTFLGDGLFREVSPKAKLTINERALINRELLNNQIGTIYGLKTIGGFEPMKTKKQSQYIDTMTSINLKMLSLMSVKYIVSTQRLSNSQLKPIPIAQNEKLPISVYLYENLEVLPMIYFTDKRNNQIDEVIYESGRAEVVAETEKGDWLIFNQSHVPGWRAFIDGSPASIYTANYLFQTVHVPTGKHKIKFIYEI